MFANIIHSFFGGLQGNSSKPSVPISQEDQPKTNEKYKTEIQALTEYFGEELKSGVCIEVELSQLLQIIPKERKRVDSYNGLVNHLKTMGVTLKITSRKTH